ncbi:protein SPA1-RELATED 3-like protein isoform X2 [Cinnamomum micranthum f. kanehirae]|uniref:Protein SPA1-RELATED 3-like protein isoform X2 n=1 Tax=Cinnamomum micranthum f. kanehirae TaxID=337451 RepID=A0A3S3QR39_9MAGN|nr:protein SPA1-RELATED 3-like protein isoform X2 [Cinnamomum micranthum f. kanehirae]
MDGSDNSGRKKSGSSRGLSDPATSTDSLRLLLGSRLGGGSRDASNESGSLAGEKACMVSSTDNFENQMGSSRVCGNEVVEVETQVMEPSEISLRHWLDKLERTVDRLECLHIFKQIVEAVNLAHSESVVVHNVRPSCFIMSSFNRVSFIESASCSSPDSDSLGDGVDSRISEHKSSSPVADGLYQERIVTEGKDSPPEVSPAGVSQRTSEASYLGMGSGVVRQEQKVEEISNAGVEDRKKSFPLKQILDMELNWYTSPEEAAGDSSSFASDIYRLGVLLFELFCTFSSNEEKLSTMSNLRHRLLPPQLLLKWPKEASFCLWLLHPQPSTRPKMSEVLQSEFLNEPRDTLEERVAAIKLKEEIEEQELLLEFLLLMQQKRQEIADKLDGTICFLSSDIEEVLKQQSLLKRQGGSYPEQNNEDHSSLERVHYPLMNPVKNENSNSVGSRKRFRPGIRVNSEEQFSEPSPEGQRSESQESILSKSSRLMKNFKKLESAYFSTRCRLMKPSGKLSLRNSTVGSVGRGSVVRTEGSSVDNLASKEGQSEGRERGWVNPFLGGLCKYLSFSKLKVRADLKQGDLVSSNLVCSLGFDRDKQFFAMAGVNRKIKIFECDAILNEARDIHYPVTEMVSRSKLSSISWNSYIKSQIASSDFEGVVQVWDVTRGQVYMEMREHERRVWSVDFSQADPTKLASGSDDGAVKLWNINQAILLLHLVDEGSVGTIRMKANVCCVQFPPDSARSLAVGSADHKIYCFDLRNMKVPWCTLIGHTRTVSHVKFVDSNTIVSASTDNSLKLWDLTMNTSQVLNSPVQTYTGHTNVKNFVGLSISDGYIATGSETNEVFVYQKSFPMPVLSFKFNSTDPLSGQEVDDSNQFVSSVCWRGQSSTLVAANSTGNIKLLEMV